MFERNIFAKDTEDIYGKIEGSTYEFYDIEKFSEAKELFEFLADYTNVEWSVMQFEGGHSFITTSHSDLADSGAGLMLNYNYDIPLLKHDHNHPVSGAEFPSGMPMSGYKYNPNEPDDIKFARNQSLNNLRMGHAVPIFRIYKSPKTSSTGSKLYIEYSGKSSPNDFIK